MSQKVKGAILTTFGGACWGLSGSMGQYLFTRQGMDSRWLVPVRLGLAGIILLIFALIRYGKSEVIRPWKTGKNAWDLVVYGLLGVSACQFFYFLTIQLSSAAVATILQDLSPVMILVVSCMMAKRKPGGLEILSIICALAGVFLLTTHGDLRDMTISPAAVLAGVMAAICVTIYNTVPGKLMEQFPLVLMQGWAFLMGGTFFALVFRPWQFHYVPNLYGYAGILFVVVVGNVVAFVSYMAGVKAIGPEKSILYAFSEPVTAAIIATVFLKTPFTVYDAAGYVLVFLMLVLISSVKQKSSAEV